MRVIATSIRKIAFIVRVVPISVKEIVISLRVVDVNKRVAVITLKEIVFTERVITITVSVAAIFLRAIAIPENVVTITGEVVAIFISSIAIFLSVIGIPNSDFFQRNLDRHLLTKPACNGFMITAPKRNNLLFPLNLPANGTMVAITRCSDIGNGTIVNLCERMVGCIARLALATKASLSFTEDHLPPTEWPIPAAKRL